MDPAPPAEKPSRVLFVCMGNICRSPAAETIFREKARRAGLQERFPCDSAGTIDYHAGMRADDRMRFAASQRGYEIRSIARPVTEEDLEHFDRIIAMDQDNLRFLRRLARRDGQADKLSLMCDYCRKQRAHEVPDPYYGGSHGFDTVLDLLEDACEGLLETLQRDGADPA